MLRSLLVSITLEGLVPGNRPRRHPVPMVRLDRVRARRTRVLTEIAAALTSAWDPPRHDPTGCPATGSAATGARIALLGSGPSPSATTG